MLGTGQRAAHLVRGEHLAPLGFSVNIAAVTLVAACFLDALLPATGGAARLGLLLVVVTHCGWWTSDAAAAAIIGGLACVLLDGFLINTQGQLSWHGAADGRRLTADATHTH